MSEFGHHYGMIGGAFVDSWGSGPYILKIGGSEFRFEDSDRFGPALLTTRDEPAARQPGPQSPFWHAHRLWVAQGRRTEQDGQTCIYSEVPTW